MGSSNRSEGGSGTAGGGPGGNTPLTEGEAVDRAFDLWLRRGLHQLYDKVAEEPIPEALLRLIAEDRAAREGGG